MPLLSAAFTEGGTKPDCLEQVSCFCRKAGISWQGGVSLGGAGGLRRCRKRCSNRLPELFPRWRRR